MEWDVVNCYMTGDQKQKGVNVVGLVIKINNAECIVQPLFQEKETGLWLEEHDVDLLTVPVVEVRILAHDYSQRMDPDRVSNPHGEHAQDVWDILEDFTLI